MTRLPGTPPLSEREGWLLQVAELLERIAALDSQYKAEVLDYERRLAEMMNEASALDASLAAAEA